MSEDQKLERVREVAKTAYPYNDLRDVAFIEGAISEAAIDYIDPVGFLEWVEDNGWVAVWSNKYKIRRWTRDTVLTFGSDSHYDELAKNGLNAIDLYNAFKNNK